ncbi:hypothetical protein BC828DRAFT_180017 [Blastocladiella britannica]|nr:hypothetical protein BC828DRAFT_180017 [Blastocladiella britannica]
MMKPAWSTARAVTAMAGRRLGHLPAAAPVPSSVHRLQVAHDSTSTNGNDNNQNRALNMGRATFVLSTELDSFCEWGLSDDSIYAVDMRFYEPTTRLHLASRAQYLAAARTLRSLLAMYYVHPHLTLTKMVQLRRPPSYSSGIDSGNDPEDGSLNDPPPDKDSLHLPRDVTEDEEGALRVSFLFSGIPRHQWIAAQLMNRNPEDHINIFEGVSVYSFNRQGLVHAHWIERLVPRPTVFKYLGGWRQKLGPSTVQEWRAGWGFRQSEGEAVPEPVRVHRKSTDPRAATKQQQQ